MAVLLSKDGPVATITLNRPEALNAINRETRLELADIFSDLLDDPDILSIVLTGGDKVFAAGADLKQLVDATPNSEFFKDAARCWKIIAGCPKPVIAAVNGYALGGGCELAMTADIIVAGESAQFGQPEIRVGIMPGAGGTQRLPRAIGKYKAMKLLLTAEMITATEADAMGLVSEVVPDDQTLVRAQALAAKIARMPPVAARAIKETVLAGQDLDLDTGLLIERKAFALLFDTEDQKEGMTAFIEKRKPVYKGR
jgi:enoyl-CoA hydratase